MGQRDDLLVGARKCLAVKGLARTTARDIAAASGANLASIGYYFGSKDNLMSIAALGAAEEWGDVIEAAVRPAKAESPAERLEIAIDELRTRLPQVRPLTVASLDAYSQAEVSEEVRRHLAELLAQGRTELAAMILGTEPNEVDPATAESLGAIVHYMVLGLTLQYLVDPQTPTGAQLAQAIQTLANRD